MATASRGTKPKVGGVRFASTQSTEGAHSHVHFDEKLHDSMVWLPRRRMGASYHSLSIDWPVPFGSCLQDAGYK
uniref:Uncharacterized protein n=1 Tax=Sphenodon punctatus TaxID=8508 RepID=A0A8D0HEH3_SPHPU